MTPGKHTHTTVKIYQSIGLMVRLHGQFFLADIATAGDDGGDGDVGVALPWTITPAAP